MIVFGHEFWMRGITDDFPCQVQKTSVEKWKKSKQLHEFFANLILILNELKMI